MTSRKNSGTAANSTGTFSGSGREGLERKGLTERSSGRKGLTEITYGRQRVNRVHRRESVLIGMSFKPITFRKLVRNFRSSLSLNLIPYSVFLCRFYISFFSFSFQLRTNIFPHKYLYVRGCGVCAHARNERKYKRRKSIISVWNENLAKRKKNPLYGNSLTLALVGLAGDTSTEPVDRGTAWSVVECQCPGADPPCSSPPSGRTPVSPSTAGSPAQRVNVTFSLLLVSIYVNIMLI